MIDIENAIRIAVDEYGEDEPAVRAWVEEMDRLLRYVPPISADLDAWAKILGKHREDGEDDDSFRKRLIDDLKPAQPGASNERA